MMVQGANRLLFWIWNYECKKSPIDGERYPDAIIGVKWNCSLEHICSKWRSCVRWTDNQTDWAMMRFYGELDGENRRLLLEWVMSNYSDEQKI